MPTDSTLPDHPDMDELLDHTCTTDRSAEFVTQANPDFEKQFIAHRQQSAKAGAPGGNVGFGTYFNPYAW